MVIFVSDTGLPTLDKSFKQLWLISISCNKCSFYGGKSFVWRIRVRNWDISTSCMEVDMVTDKPFGSTSRSGMSKTYTLPGQIYDLIFWPGVTHKRKQVKVYITRYWNSGAHTPSRLPRVISAVTTQPERASDH